MISYSLGKKFFTFLLIAAVISIIAGIGSATKALAEQKVTGKAILFDLSHSPTIENNTLEESYASWIAEIEDEGHSVTVDSDFDNLDNYDVVIQVAPQTAFATADVTTISDYLDNDGVLILFGEASDYYGTTYLNNLLTALSIGIEIIYSTVYDYSYYYRYTSWPAISDFSDQCLNEGLNNLFFGRTAYLDVTNPEMVLAESSSESRVGSTYGPFPVTAISDPAINPGWKVVVSADASFLGTWSYEDLYWLGSNRRAGMNLIEWCVPECAENIECDDGLWCNGEETCDPWFQCRAGEDPCPDDGKFCTGEESCDEAGDQCEIINLPDCSDDSEYCNGDEYCNEGQNKCDHSGDPCTDNGQWCDGEEACEEANDQCIHINVPDCSDDGIFCNGIEACKEADDACVHSGDPCTDDGFWCNGTESCNEDQDKCDHSGTPCPDDDFWCNGQSICDEENLMCFTSGEPCTEGQFCNEELDQCEAPSDDDDDQTDDDDDTVIDDDDDNDDGGVKDDDDDDDDDDKSCG